MQAGILRVNFCCIATFSLTIHSDALYDIRNFPLIPGRPSAGFGIRQAFNKKSPNAKESKWNRDSYSDK
jgi:hypothetical protein